jgi:hypothetical protein
VVLYRHQSWVLPLLESEPTGVVIEEASGFVRLSRAA